MKTAGRTLLEGRAMTPGHREVNASMKSGAISTNAMSERQERPGRHDVLYAHVH